MAAAAIHDFTFFLLVSREREKSFQKVSFPSGREGILTFPFCGCSLTEPPLKVDVHAVPCFPEWRKKHPKTAQAWKLAA
jgi:hypothetical protein